MADRLHNCKATWFGFQPELMAKDGFSNIWMRELLIQLQTHRNKIDAAEKVFFDEYYDPTGTLHCVFYSGEQHG